MAAAATASDRALQMEEAAKVKAYAVQMHTNAIVAKRLAQAKVKQQCVHLVFHLCFPFV